MAILTGSGTTDFPYQMKLLNRQMFTIIAWDPPGYGFSRPPDRTWPTDFLRRDGRVAARLMETIGFKKYSLVGWSDGGISAIMMANSYSENIENLIIFGACSHMADKDVEVNESIRNIDDWSPRLRKPFEDVYDKEYFRQIASDWVDAYNCYIHSNKNGIKGEICTNDLEQVSCPVLLIHGEKDALVPRYQVDSIWEIVRKRTLAKLVFFPDGKHNIHMKYHKKINSLIEHFVINPKSFQDIAYEKDVN